MLERGGIQALFAVTSLPLNIHSQSRGGGGASLGRYGKLPPLSYQGSKRGKSKVLPIILRNRGKLRGIHAYTITGLAPTILTSAVGFWESSRATIVGLGRGFEEDEAMTVTRKKRMEKSVNKRGFFSFFLSFSLSKSETFYLILQNQNFYDKGFNSEGWWLRSFELKSLIT